MALASQHSHAVGLVDGGRAGAHFRVKETRRDNVDASKVAPLAGQRLAKVRDKGLCAVVYGLVGGDVDNVAAHARGDDQVAGALALEDFSYVLGAVHDPIDWFLTRYHK